MGLLGRAKNLIKGLTTSNEAAVQYYNVVCPLGHRVRGQRTEGYQALRCPACGEGVFVLPVSPLPDPGPRLAARSGRRSVDPLGESRVVEEGPIELEDAGEEATIEMADPARSPGDVEIPWEEEVEAPQRAGAEAPAAGGDRAAPVRRSEVAAPPRPEASRRPGRPVAEPAMIEVEPRRRRRQGWSPFWIFGVVALLVLGTVLLRVSRNRRQAYPQIAERGRSEGIPALEAGEFDRAYQLLAPAKRAVDGLGGEIEGADRIRQAADEADLYVNLATAGLEEMLDEAHRKTAEPCAPIFAQLYKGRGVVFDTRIKATPDGPVRRYEIDYVVLPTEQAASFRAGGLRPAATGRIDFTGFELFELAKPATGDHIVFGARLAGFRYDASANEWVVSLEPKSGLFVQFHKALESLGWPEEIEAETPDEVGGVR